MKQLIAVVLIIIVVIAGVLVFRSTSDKTDMSNQDTPSSSEQPEEQMSQTYSLEDVAKHNTESDCWTVINNSVYNLTSYIPRHQGGDEILRACGTDGTSLFEERRTEDGEEVGSGTPHSQNAQAALERLKIGTLAE